MHGVQINLYYEFFPSFFTGVPARLDEISETLYDTRLCPSLAPARLKRLRGKFVAMLLLAPR